MTMEKLLVTPDPDGRGATIAIVSDGTPPPIDNGGTNVLTKAEIKRWLAEIIRLGDGLKHLIPGSVDDMAIMFLALLMANEELLDMILGVFVKNGLTNVDQLRAAGMPALQMALAGCLPAAVPAAKKK